MSVDREHVPTVSPLGHALGRATVVPIAYLLYRMRHVGSEHVPMQGGLLIVSNHVSNLDPPLIGAAALPRILYYMAKTELFEHPVLRRMILSQGAFPVDRGAADRSAMRVAREILGRGDALLMFPEGTRSSEGRLGAPFAGAGTLAFVPGVTVVPAATWGGQRRLGPVRVAFGPPIDMSDLSSGPRSERARAAADRMMEGIARLLPIVGGPVQEHLLGAPGDG